MGDQSNFRLKTDISNNKKNKKNPISDLRKNMPPKKTISEGRVKKRPVEEEIEALEEENKMEDENKQK